MFNRDAASRVDIVSQRAWDREYRAEAVLEHVASGDSASELPNTWISTGTWSWRHASRQSQPRRLCIENNNTSSLFSDIATGGYQNDQSI